MTVSEKMEALSQFAALNPHGDVVFTGGEPFSKPSELFNLSMHARGLGLGTVTNSNGYGFSEELIRDTLRFGPDTLVFSIDAPTAGDHDFIRGLDGAFAHTMTTVRRLLDLRAPNSDVKILFSCILSRQSLPAFDELVLLARRIGVDGVTFQMLEKTFFNRSKTDKHFDQNRLRQDGETARRLASVAAKYKDDPFVLLNEADFASFSLLTSGKTPLPFSLCSAAKDNLTIDMFGNLRFCSYMTEQLKLDPLGNIRNATIGEILVAPATIAVKSRLLDCRLPCGALNCNRKKELRVSASGDFLE